MFKLFYWFLHGCLTVPLHWLQNYKGPFRNFSRVYTIQTSSNKPHQKWPKTHSLEIRALTKEWNKYTVNSSGHWKVAWKQYFSEGNLLDEIWEWLVDPPRLNLTSCKMTLNSRPAASDYRFSESEIQLEYAFCSPSTTTSEKLQYIRNPGTLKATLFFSTNWRSYY